MMQAEIEETLTVCRGYLLGNIVDSDGQSWELWSPSGNLAGFWPTRPEAFAACLSDHRNTGCKDPACHFTLVPDAPIA